MSFLSARNSLTVAGLLLGALAPAAAAVGTWTPVTTAPANISTMLLLTDGTVMAQAYDDVRWYRLAPDVSGNYATGTWSALASMHYARLYYASAILNDGRVIVAGAEYGANLDSSGGTGAVSVEVYSPLANQWTVLSSWTAGHIDDATGAILDDGRFLLLPKPANYGQIWNPTNDTWTTTSTKANFTQNDEETAVHLPDGSFIIPSAASFPGSQRYFPSTNQWVNAGNLPANIVDSKFEMGGGMLLADGRVVFFGATGATDFFNPGTGTWVSGPTIPDGSKQDDAPLAMLPNGRVLIVGDQGGPSFSPPSRMYEFDPTSNSYAAVPAPSTTVTNLGAYTGRMLLLPTGQVLFSFGGSGTTVPYLYTPSGAALSTATPSLTSITANGNGDGHLIGLQFTGINEGAAYGDDAQMATNYPIVRLTSGGGQVRYARTFNFSTRAVATGNLTVSADVSFAGIPDGGYTLNVVANGIPSNSQSISVAGGKLSNGPVVSVSLVSGNEWTTEYLSRTASYTISRPSTATGSPLTVAFALSGNATLGTDYTVSPGSSSVTIPAGSAATLVTITPIADGVYDPNETATLTISPSANYTVGTASATIQLYDQDLVLTSLVPSGAYPGNAPPFAYRNITLSGAATVANGSTVTLFAKNHIDLLPGTTLTAGCSFDAKIQ